MNGPKCIYLGEPTEEITEVKIMEGTCCGASTYVKKLKVHLCGKHRLCLPKYMCKRSALSEEIISGNYYQPCTLCQDKCYGDS